jgi:endonuclease YncB( thermonuclease family)
MDKFAMKLGLACATAIGAWIGLSVPISAGSWSPQAKSVARFSLCHTGGGVNCVVDGDTAWIDGIKVRIADIDAPETHPPRCARESELGRRATLRLQALMNAGPFEQRSIDRNTDRYGRRLRVLVREGQSLGDQLVAEGLARPYAGGRRPWC